MAGSGCDSARAAIGLLLAGLIGGCGTTQHIYTLQPMPVAVDPSEERWGVEVAIQIKDAIHLELVNESKDPVRILWEDCAYIDVDRRSHRLRTASGGPASHIPVSVAPGSRVEAELMPVEDLMSGNNDPLLSGKPKKPRQPGLLRRLWPFHGAEAGSEALGKPITLFLALERDGMRRTVTAPYTITAIHTERHW